MGKNYDLCAVPGCRQPRLASGGALGGDYVSAMCGAHSGPVTQVKLQFGGGLYQAEIKDDKLILTLRAAEPSNDLINHVAGLVGPNLLDAAMAKLCELSVLATIMDARVK